MSLRSFYVVLGVMICLQQLPAEASPPMNIRKLYESASGIKFKKDETPLSVPDEDVLELEQLKQKNNANGYDDANQDDTLPPLERLLEYEATKSAINLGQPEEEGPSVVQHRPQQITPPQSTHDFQASNLEPPVNVNVEKAPIKPFYGAARLAFGQNPEIITTASTTTVTPSTTDAAPIINTNTPVSTASSTAAPSSTTLVETDAAADTLVSELEATKNGERRSVDMMPPKTAESLLKHKDGQYSSFDMAQYVFWTGDEAGVARAVEEFIQQGLMSRETAIKFLRDIRLGIEYLQSSYTNRIIPDHMKPAASYMISPIATTTHAPPTTTEKQQPSEPENLILTPNLQKALEGIPSLLRLQEVNNARSKDNSLDYDEMAGRMRVADFLYAEYSLEEVIYQLAKVMFSQSLTHGSEQSQRALQRLTAFLESEGEHGRISPGLQKKILDVLLAALSDTLAEHPELLAAARAELGNSFHKLPKNILDPMKN